MLVKFLETRESLRNFCKAFYEEYRNTGDLEYEFAVDFIIGKFDEKCFSDVGNRKLQDLHDEVLAAGERYSDFGGDAVCEDFDNRAFALLDELKDSAFPFILIAGAVWGREGRGSLFTQFFSYLELKEVPTEELMDCILEETGHIPAYFSKPVP